MMKLLYVDDIIACCVTNMLNLIHNFVAMFRTSKRRGRLSEAREINTNFDCNIFTTKRVLPLLNWFCIFSRQRYRSL
jgi:hypothetical protein